MASPGIGNRFQEETKYVRGKLKGGYLDWKNKPELYKEYPKKKKIILPPHNLFESRPLTALLKKRKSQCAVSLSAMLLQPRAMRKELLREAFLQTGANVKKLTYRHWKDLEDFISTKAKGKRLDLPDGVTLHKYANELRFIR